MEIQTFMKGRSCYTNRDNTEVKLWHDAVVVPVSTWIHSPYIHKYCDFHSWWTAVELYLIDQLKSDQVSKNLVTQSLTHLSCHRFVNYNPDLHRTLLVITGALIERTVTQREISCHYR